MVRATGVLHLTAMIMYSRMVCISSDMIISMLKQPDTVTVPSPFRLGRYSQKDLVLSAGLSKSKNNDLASTSISSSDSHQP